MLPIASILSLSLRLPLKPSDLMWISDSTSHAAGLRQSSRRREEKQKVLIGLVSQFFELRWFHQTGFTQKREKNIGKCWGSQAQSLEQPMSSLTRLILCLPPPKTNSLYNTLPNKRPRICLRWVLFAHLIFWCKGCPVWDYNTHNSSQEISSRPLIFDCKDAVLEMPLTCMHAWS